MNSWKLTMPDIPVDEILENWRWLVSEQMELTAIGAFGDLVLVDGRGCVHVLDVNGGDITQVARSTGLFERDEHLQREVLFADVAESLFQRGWELPKGKCFGYKTPIVFAESSGSAENIYIADIREYVPFLGDLHQQLKNAPDGSQVRLRVKQNA